MSVLVLVEVEDGAPTGPSLEALAVADRAAAGHGLPVQAVSVGDPPVEAGFGQITRWYRLGGPDLDGYSPELYGAALSQLVGDVGPLLVVGPGSDRGMEVLAQAAARADAPLAANCTSVVSTDPGVWSLTRVRQGGMLLEDAEVNATPTLVTVATGVVAPAEPSSAATPADVVDVTPDLHGVVHSTLVDRTVHDAGVTLATARVVVSGGRGVGSAEGFAPLEELAKLTGGAVGCSRVATNNGWRPHSDQVGQTGTKISPDLYIACGISGATQHWVGCMNAKAILAINTDPEAPLVTRATYAVIGDAREVIQAVVDEIHHRTSP